MTMLLYRHTEVITQLLKTLKINVQLRLETLKCFFVLKLLISK